MPARTSSARWRKAARSKPGPNRVRWPTPCAGAGTGPSACSPATAPNREALERQEGFDETAHARTAERLADAVEERERLPVSFEPPAPPPAEHRPQADDPPEETYEEDGWVGDERPSDEDRVDSAENDWLYQRREGFAELYDPWTPESVELRRRNSLAWEDARCGNGLFDPDEPQGSDNGEFAPRHDIS